MATRFYFPASTAADVSPAFDGLWTDTNDAVRRKMVTTKGSSAIAVGSTVSFTQTDFALDRQYVSEPLAAQTILGTGTASMQLMVREFADTDNVDYVIVSIRICSNDGLTIKGQLLNAAGYGTVGTEFINNATCRNCICITGGTWDFGTNGDSGGGNYTVNDGDRLVVDIGYGCNTGLATTPQAAAKWGENATDLPVDDTQTTDGAGWIEFSQTLTFSATTHAGAASMNVVLTQVSTGNLIARSGADMNATVTMAADGIRQAQGEAGMNIVLTEVAAGIRVANGSAGMNASVTVSADGNRQAQGAAGMSVVVTVAANGTVPQPPMVRVRAYVKASSQPVASVSGSAQPRVLSRGSEQPTVNTEGSSQPVGVVRASN